MYVRQRKRNFYHLSLMEDGNYLLVENATIQKI